MNRTAAIRLAVPGYSPAKGTRIYADRWYRVTLQDMDEDARCDYIGLKDTATAYIMRGDKAREERDSHLNRCNKIEEYAGPVYAVTWREYGMTEQTVYTDAMEDARRVAADVEKKRRDHIAACEKEAARNRERAERATGITILNTGPVSERDLYLSWAKDCDEGARRARATNWGVAIKRVQ